jgi:hypothetical protein
MEGLGLCLVGLCLQEVHVVVCERQIADGRIGASFEHKLVHAGNCA